MKRLRGVNFGGWLSQIDAIEEKDPFNFKGIDYHMSNFLGVDDFTAIAKWGFNHVRLPVDYNYFFEEDLTPVKSRFHILDEAVGAALANNLDLIIDLHKCPGHTFHDESKSVQKLFKDDEYVKKTQKVWEYLAIRYAPFKNTIFELLNEPVAPASGDWNRVKGEIVKSIRLHAPDKKIILGSNMWNWPSTYNELTPVDDENIIYCFHFYEPLLFTHQLAPWLPEPEFKVERSYPGDYGEGVVRQYDLKMSEGKWDKSRFINEIQPVIDFGKNNNVQIICNEFGVYAGAQRESQLKWMSDFLEVLNENSIGFSYWNYKNLDFGIISEGESLHAKLERYNNPKHIDNDILNLLKNN
ncbi:MAG: glycoside hydrolase family 5 protein [Deltaproteobacteria bacterium]|nr:glycoside hydrolase family 5 protein [Deltaproteobacteria bacterium]